MSETPEVFTEFAKKLAHVFSFIPVPIRDFSASRKDSMQKAIKELASYFSSIVERASLAEKKVAELEKDNAEFRQLIHDWIIILTPDNDYVPNIDGVRDAMILIDKEGKK